MATLKEIKGRISSVRSTLKITSAMKLVSSAKLRKAQKAIEAMRPYEQELQGILASIQGTLASPQGLPDTKTAQSVSGLLETGEASTKTAQSVRGRVAFVAIASNSSLCGGFNAAAVAKVRSLRQKGDVVYSIGRKMADAMRRDGYPSPEDFSALSENPAYEPAAALVSRLEEDVREGRLSGVILVYNHYVSTARQVPVAERLLPVEEVPETAEEKPDGVGPIIEPSRRELLAQLLPKTLRLKLYAALLDSAAAEHAARTVAMQTATDNGENLLEELTLQYNKGRQQKITSEILDLAGGQAEQ